MYVTLSELIQIGIFIVTLVGVCYTIMHGKGKQRQKMRKKLIDYYNVNAVRFSAETLSVNFLPPNIASYPISLQRPTSTTSTAIQDVTQKPFLISATTRKAQMVWNSYVNQHINVWVFWGAHAFFKSYPRYPNTMVSGRVSQFYIIRWKNCLRSCTR